MSCHDDLTASDLVGRYLITAGDTVWVDGPLARAVRAGGICYLDEIVEARKDTTVVIHPLADDRRVLPMEKLGELLEAPRRILPRHFLQPRLPERAEGPQAVAPGSASSRSNSTIPRPNSRRNRRHESGVDAGMAEKLVKFAHMTRNLKGSGLDEGASTRLLVHAGKLISSGVDPVVACRSAIAQALTDDADMLAAIRELSSSLF